jgi:transposase-like protein
MSEITITERQQHWLGHLQAAEAFDGTLAEYARSAGLEPQTLYSWRAVLRSRGLLAPQASERPSGFVQVMGRGSAPTTPPSAVSLLLPNGARLACHGELGPEQLEALVLAAGRLP